METWATAAILFMSVLVASLGLRRLRFALRTDTPVLPLSWRTFFERDLHDNQKSRSQVLVEATVARFSAPGTAIQVGI
jgi:hypothetical protein